MGCSEQYEICLDTCHLKKVENRTKNTKDMGKYFKKYINSQKSTKS